MSPIADLARPRRPPARSRPAPRCRGRRPHRARPPASCRWPHGVARVAPVAARSHPDRDRRRRVHRARPTARSRGRRCSNRSSPTSTSAHVAHRRDRRSPDVVAESEVSPRGVRHARLTGAGSPPTPSTSPRDASGQWHGCSRPHRRTGRCRLHVHRPLRVAPGPSRRHLAPLARLWRCVRSIRSPTSSGTSSLIVANTKNPRIVVMSGGVDHSSFVDQSYLATRLGLNLAEGADLVVRQRRLWLRSLAGLEPIDVLLRRLEDDRIDPMEVNAKGTVAVPGLLLTPCVHASGQPRELARQRGARGSRRSPIRGRRWRRG